MTLWVSRSFCETFLHHSFQRPVSHSGHRAWQSEMVHIPMQPGIWSEIPAFLPTSSSFQKSVGYLHIYVFQHSFLGGHFDFSTISTCYLQQEQEAFCDSVVKQH